MWIFLPVIFTEVSIYLISNLVEAVKKSDWIFKSTK